MDLRKKVLETIKEHELLSEGMHVVLGLSGGPDSMCLFHALYSLKDELGIQIHPVHINHRFRSGAAEEDQAYVERVSEEYGLKCRTFVIDCREKAEREGLSSEEAGRIARYESFFSVCREICSEYNLPEEKVAVAVAHNANDQAETVLFRILRGTSVDGLSGIQHSRKDKSGFRVIRPVLDIRREEIEAYCEAEKLNPRIDLTNDEAIYTRNKIRLELIPFIEERFNPNIVETLNRLGRAALSDSEYLLEEAAQLAGKEVFTKSLESRHRAIRYRVYTLSLNSIGMVENITTAHLEAADRVLFSENPSAEADLSDGYRVSKNYDRLVFYNENQIVPENEGQWIVEELSSEEALKKIERAVKENRLYAAFAASEELKAEMLEIRTRRDGDFLPMKKGSKKIQDLMVDSKVPKMYRDSMLLLAKGREVLWVLPSEHFADERNRRKGRFCEKYKAEFNGDKKVIYLEMK